MELLDGTEIFLALSSVWGMKSSCELALIAMQSLTTM